MAVADAAFVAPAGKDVLGHPRGLWYLSFAEAWERFSYYGMQALLALYLTHYLLLPGHIENVAGFETFKHAISAAYEWLGRIFGIGGGGDLATPIATAAAITGVYSAGVYATPMIGGWVADQFIGRTAAVTIGASLMVLGHFLMAFDTAFVGAIICLFLGVGLFKGNIASQVGELYGPSDLRRSNGFQVFFLGIQIAVIVSPLIVGYLGERVAWHYGFGAAGVGMAFGLIVYLWGRKYLPPERPRGARAAAAPPQPKLTGRDWATMAVLVALLPVLAATALGNQEIFNAYLLWGDAHYNLVFFGETMPTTWLISLDAIISTATVAGALAFWTVWARYRKEPDEIVKCAIGALIAAGAPLLLAAASTQEALTGEKVSLIWGFGFHIVNDIGFAMLFPVGLALYSRAAPRQVGGMFIGVYYLHLFLANLATGKVAGLVETMDGATFWGMHVAIIAGGAVVLVVFAILFRKLLAPKVEDLAPAQGAAQPG